eukprot:11204499-Lingulodinium_polyedra.AAC.1
MGGSAGGSFVGGPNGPGPGAAAGPAGGVALSACTPPPTAGPPTPAARGPLALLRADADSGVAESASNHPRAPPK